MKKIPNVVLQSDFEHNQEIPTAKLKSNMFIPYYILLAAVAFAETTLKRASKLEMTGH